MIRATADTVRVLLFVDQTTVQGREPEAAGGPEPGRDVDGSPVRWLARRRHLVVLTPS